MEPGPSRMRLGRRSLCRAAGPILAASVLLAGCGGASDSDPGTSAPEASALEHAAETTAEVREPKPEPPSPPEVGDELVSFSGSGRVNVVGGSGGFSIVESLFDLGTDTDESTLHVFDVNGAEVSSLPPGSFAGECGVADVEVPEVGRLILTEREVTKPAQGVVPASGWTDLEAREAETGQLLWDARIYDEAAGCGAYDGRLEGFAGTPGGRWGLVGLAEGGWVVDLASGQLRMDSRAIGIIGNYVVDAVGPDGETYQLTDPATGAGFGKISSDAGVKGSVSFYSNFDIAPSGVFDYDGSGSSPPAGVSADGERLIAIRNDGGGIAGEGGQVTAYSLPSAEVIWEAGTPESASLAGSAGGVLVMSEEDCRGQYGCLVGIDDQTGTKLWTLPSGGVCAMSESQMILTINEQLAVIDLETGEQVSYSEGEPCPTVLPGGIGVFTGSNELLEAQEVTVIQVLEP